MQEMMQLTALAVRSLPLLSEKLQIIPPFFFGTYVGDAEICQGHVHIFIFFISMFSDPLRVIFQGAAKKEEDLAFALKFQFTFTLYSL